MRKNFMDMFPEFKKSKDAEDSEDRRVAMFIYVGYGILILFYLSMCVGGWWFLYLLTKIVNGWLG